MASIHQIFFLLQGIAQQRKPKYILYSGMGYTLQEFRMTGVTPYMIDKFADWLKSQNCQYSFMASAIYCLISRTQSKIINFLAGNIPQVCRHHEAISGWQVGHCRQYPVQRLEV